MSENQINKKLVEMRKRVGHVLKGGENKFDRYKYATLENYVNAVAPILAEIGLYETFSILEVVRLENRPTKNGGSEQAVQVHAEMAVWDEHGNSRAVKCFGEGQDRADKAIYKAVTGARKYAYGQLFGLATTDDPESDESVGQSAAPKYQPPPAMPAQVMAPKTKDVPESFKAFMSGWVKSSQGKQLWADAKQYKLAPNSLLGQYELMLACGWKESMSPDEVDAMEAFLVRRTVEQAEVIKADGAAENIPL